MLITATRKEETKFARLARREMVEQDNGVYVRVLDWSLATLFSPAMSWMNALLNLSPLARRRVLLLLLSVWWHHPTLLSLSIGRSTRMLLTLILSIHVGIMAWMRWVVRHRRALLIQFGTTLIAHSTRLPSQ